MKVKINLTEIIAQAAKQICGDDDQALLYQWLRLNGSQEQLATVDIPDSAIKTGAEKRAKEIYTVRSLPENELTRAIGVKWGICEAQPTARPDVALCYSEQEVRRICAVLNHYEAEHDTKPL
jgi:hypothetical protein